MSKIGVFSLVCAGIFAMIAPCAHADQWDQRTVFTFSGPVEIPGRVLPAGTYVFKLLDSQSNRDIVQVFDKDEAHVYGTVIAIPDYRLRPSGKTILTFEERATGSPEAVKAWFYPGDNYGHEFVYPKVKALELAKVNNQAVAAMPNETKPAVTELKNAQVRAETPAQQEEPVTNAFPMPPQGHHHNPAPPQEVAQNTPPPAPAENNAPALPQTGSSLPLLGLIGVMSLACGALLRRQPSRR